MIIDTHCHFDMMKSPESYIQEIENKGDIVIGMTNMPSHFKMGVPFVKKYKHVRLALGLHPLLASEQDNELELFKRLLPQTSYIGEVGLDFSRDGYSIKEKQIKNFEKPLTYHKIHGMILPVECGGIAQLARARGSYPRCRWFKSSSRYFEKGLYKPFFYFFKEQTDTGKLIIAKVTVVAARRVSGESSSVK